MHARAVAVLLAAAAPVAAGLFAGAAGAPNDVVAKATPIASLPASVEGTTEHAGVVKEPVVSCSPGTGTVWYLATAPRRGPMAAILRAAGSSDAAVAVYRVVRTGEWQQACGKTDLRGRAAAAWYAYRGQQFLIGVAARAGAPTGRFRLTVAAKEPDHRPPGDPLPVAGVTNTLDPVTDRVDAWSTHLDRGTTYRISLTSSEACPALQLFRGGVWSFADAEPIGGAGCGYHTFTPGIDGGGLYSLVVRASGTQPHRYGYRLVVQPAERDDIAPGVAVESGRKVSGTLNLDGIDVLDLYSFVVPHANALTTVRVAPAPSLTYDLVVLDETGNPVDSSGEVRGPQLLSEHLKVGRYFTAVRAIGRSKGAYDLTVLTREVTTTTLTANGQRYLESTAGAAVQLQAYVTGVSHGGAIQVEIDRLDPLSGWDFQSVIDGQVDASGRFSTTWTPPYVGHWQIRARFPGNEYSTMSSSAYVRVHVAAPVTG